MELALRILKPNNASGYSRIPSSNESNSSQEYTHTDDDTTQLYQKLDNLIGHFGPYQRTVCLIALTINIFMGLNAVLPNFAAARPEFRCKTCLDPLDSTNNNVTDDYLRLNFYDVSEDSCGASVVDGCKIQMEMVPGFNTSQDTVLQECCPANGKGSCTTSELDRITHLQTVGCSEYVYDDSIYKSTIVTDFKKLLKS